MKQHLHILSETRSGSTVCAELYTKPPHSETKQGYTPISDLVYNDKPLRHEFINTSTRFQDELFSVSEIEEILNVIESERYPLVFKNHWIDIHNRLGENESILNKVWNLNAKKLCLMRRNKLEHILSKVYSTFTKNYLKIPRNRMHIERVKVEIPSDLFERKCKGTMREFKLFYNWAKQHGDEIVWHEDLIIPSTTKEQKIHPYSELITNLNELIERFNDKYLYKEKDNDYFSNKIKDLNGREN